MSLSERSMDDDAVLIDRDDISNYNPEQILPERPETIHNIRSWLQPTSYNDVGGEYRRHLASHVPGTGAWLTSSAEYRQWLQGTDGPQGLLWIRGIPGSGKSVIAAKLIDELARTNPGCPVLFFFFRQIIKANHSPQALLRDWMDQLLEYSPPLQKQLLTYVEAGRPVDTISMQDMFKDIRIALAGLPGKAFCIADALDEMDPGHNMDTFLDTLASLGQWRPGAVKVLITSRPVPIVERPLRMVPCLHLRLQESLVDVDISTYVEFALSTYGSAIQASDRQLIRDAVPGRANGLFLYARLAMDAFLRPGADINQVLRKLPVNLNALYDDLLEEHARRSDVPANVQFLILQAVTHTARPLRLLELATMIRSVCSDESAGPGSEKDLKATKDLIRTACGPLLEILPDETVSVIHHSLTEFLKGNTRSDDGSSRYPILQPGPTHAQLALACLRYLQSGCLDDVNAIHKQRNGPSDWYYRTSWSTGEAIASQGGHVPEPYVQMRLQHPFVEYAVCYWHHHVRKSEAAGHNQVQLDSEIRKFLGDSRAVEPWIRLTWRDYLDERLITQLHIAARAGFVSYFKDLVGKTEMEVDAHDVGGRTALWWAASEGHEEVIQVLIAAGADPDAPGESPDGCGSQAGIRPLHQAAIRDHGAAVKVLLDAGVHPLQHEPSPNHSASARGDDKYPPWTIWDSPLVAACLNGCLETVDLLLPYVKDVDISQQALAWAADGGQSKLVAKLLGHPGVNVNAKVDGNTPVYLACRALSAATIETLLRAGADPNIRCDNSRDRVGPRYQDASAGGAGLPSLNCLHRLCGVGVVRVLLYPDDDTMCKIFALLIQHGVDVNASTPWRQTALHGAVTKSPILTKLLVEAGADTNTRDHKGDTPLCLVRSDCFIDTDPIELLIDKGHADINHIRSDGDTVLNSMIGPAPLERVLKFLEYRPECNVLNARGHSPLHKALLYKLVPELVEGLLKAGADPNMKTRDGLTPLLCLVANDNHSPDIIKIADLLLGAGADFNTVDRDGRPLLFHLLPTHKLLWRDQEALGLFREFVARGASTSARDFHGRTILHKMVQKVTPLRTECRAIEMPGNMESDCNMLLDLGLDIKVTDHAGNGLLHEIAFREDNSSPSSLVWLWEYLIAMGLDLNQKNHAGRTPLHILCSLERSSCYNQGGVKINPIDLVISRIKNLNDADNDGVTPLHISATRGQVYTKKLLDAGADPMARTREGLTALHLASRCGQSNTVGLLLGALRRETPTTAPDTTLNQHTNESWSPVKGVNAEADGRDDITPLFYACQSGRHETVELLLGAGADATSGNVLQACLEFESQGRLSLRGSGGPRRENKDDRLLLLDGTSPVNSEEQGRRKPKVGDQDLSTDETRSLEEILRMLVVSGADLSRLGQVGGLIDRAVTSGRDYTARCFVHVRDKNMATSHGAATAVQESVPSTMSGLMHHSLKEASVQTLSVSGLVEQGAPNQELFRYFLGRREYHLVQELARLGADFLRMPPGKKQVCNLAIMVRGGLYSLVNQVGEFVAKSRLDKGKADWHAFGEPTRPGLWFANRGGLDLKDVPVPFLTEAAQRELPNLTMMRLLVDKFGVDINETRLGPGKVRHEDGRLMWKLVSTGSALHHVARGFSWWHVHQALPYLLEAGADINVRNYQDMTPLHAALGGLQDCQPARVHLGPFAKEAARMLVEKGADVNAVGNTFEKERQSCLAFAAQAQGVDMIRLLVRYGATVTAEALFAAIQANHVAGVRELLSVRAEASMMRRERLSRAEFDADGRLLSPHGYSVMTKLMGAPLHHEAFPLYYAGMASALCWRGPGERPAWEEFPDPEPVKQMVQALLDHGADPYARFLSRVNKEWETASSSDTTRDTPLIEVPEAHRECTVLHELLLAGAVMDPFLRLPGLDVNRRDAKGRTLLLAACQGRGGPDAMCQDGCVSIFQKLISLGAEMEARDNIGWNALHHMITGNDFTNTFDNFKDSLAGLVHHAPHLANQADDAGKTPLHYAVYRADMSRDARAVDTLLSAGADVVVVDEDGNNLLHVLAKSLDSPAQRRLFQDLVSRGVDINGRNGRGETPLFIFCKHEKSGNRAMSTEIPELSDDGALAMLRGLGADVFARDDRGKGLLHVVAASWGGVELFMELLDAGLDATMEDESQQSAIDVAAVAGKQDILQLFDKNAGR